MSESVDYQLGQIVARLDAIDARSERIETKVDGIDGRLRHVEARAVSLGTVAGAVVSVGVALITHSLKGGGGS